MSQNELQLILDCAARLQILDLFGRYCRLIDRCAWQDLDRVFTPDVEVDFSSTAAYVKGNALIQGIGALKEFYETAMSHIGPGVTYFMTGHVIDVQGDTARASCYSQTLSFPYGGYYDTEVRKGPDGWRFSKLTYEWRHFEEVMNRLKNHMKTEDAKRE